MVIAQADDELFTSQAYSKRNAAEWVKRLPKIVENPAARTALHEPMISDSSCCVLNGVNIIHNHS